MKKIVFAGAVGFFCLVACGISFAETVGNTADIHLPPGRGIYSAQLGDFIALNVGMDTEFLIEKKLKNDSEGSTGQKLKGIYYMGKFSCTLFDRVEPYVTLGIAQLEARWNDGTRAVKLETAYAPSWGAGLKAYLWEFEGLGLKVFSTASLRSTKPNRLRSATVGGVEGALTRDRVEFLEKQVTAGISREFFLFGMDNFSIVPYMGVAWSETAARVRFKKGSYPVSFGATGQEENLGLFVGTDFIILDNLSLNIEGRFNDQEAVSLGFIALF